MDSAQLKKILECLLFVACEPLTIKQLREICDVDSEQLRTSLAELAEDYRQRGIQLRQVAGGWQFFSDSEYAAYIEKLYKPKVQQLSNAAMETLAIIAYKQPITRAEVSAIRHVESDGVITTLLEKHLIKETGRRSGIGRAILYGTTAQFLTFFGINSLADLPKIDPQELEQQQLSINL